MRKDLSWRALLSALLWLSLLLLQAPASWAADLIENVGEGRINWSLGLLTANGIGAPPKDLKNPAQVRAMTQRAAITVARRNLLEVLKGVRIDAATTVENFIVSSDVIKTQVSGVLQGSQVMQTKYFSDGSIEVTVGVYVRGELASILMPTSLFLATPALPSPSREKRPPEKPASQAPTATREQTAPPVKEALKEPTPIATAPSAAPEAAREEGKKEEVRPKIESSSPSPAEKREGEPSAKKTEVVGRPATEKASAAPEVAPTQPPVPLRPEVSPTQPPSVAGKTEEKKVPAPEEKKPVEAKLPPTPAPVMATGLVVDARGLGLKPALLPRIFDEGGNEVYSTRQVGRQSALEQGLVGYAKDVSAAQRNIRVTDKPLLVKGIKAVGKERTDVVIPDPDAATIVAAVSVSNFLEKSRVIVVYD